MSGETIIQPDDSWVVTFPVAEGLTSAKAMEMRDEVMRWAKGEGVRPPLVIFGGTVDIPPKEQS